MKFKSVRVAGSIGGVKATVELDLTPIEAEDICDAIATRDRSRYARNMAITLANIMLAATETPDAEETK